MHAQARLLAAAAYAIATSSKKLYGVLWPFGKAGLQ